MPTEAYLGFDFGLQRIGVAVGQALTRTAQPLTTLAAQQGQPDWEAVARLIADWRPAALVVGVPRHDDGSPLSVTEPARRFGRRLHGRFGLPVHEVDERLSSRAAEDHLAEHGRGGRRLSKNKGAIDRLAAAVILETWLAEHHD